jgi:4-amino-4-deoxy-L-arabinose transferase-like glycosyltransferase
VALALALRLALALSAAPNHIGGDPGVYDQVAVSLAGGRGWSRPARATGAYRPTALHPPAWPAVLGAAYALTDHEDRPDVAAVRVRRAELTARSLATSQARWRDGRVVNALLETCAVALLGLIALELWGRRVALLAAAVAALYPALAVLGLALLSEPLFVALELGAVYAALRARSGRPAWTALAGVLCGLAVLTRANGAVLLLPLALAVPRRAIPVLVAAAVLVVAPWTVRNLDVLHARVPVSTDLGQTLAGTYNPASALDRFRWRNTRRLPPPDRPAAHRPTEAARSAALTRDGLRYLAAHPADVGLATVWNTARLLELDPVARESLAGEVQSRTLAAVSVGGFALLAALAPAGAFTRRARGAPRWLWLVPLLMWAGTVPFAVNFSRFRAPIDPFLELLAALTLAAAAPAVRRAAGWRPRRRRPPGRAAATAAARAPRLRLR